MSSINKNDDRYPKKNNYVYDTIIEYDHITGEI